MNNTKINALKTIEKDLISLKVKAMKKVEKQLEKQKSKSIKFKGNVCYTHEDIDDIYYCDGCTLSECEKAHERLDKCFNSTEKIADTEKYIKIVGNLLYNIQCELEELNC
jgi:hypothetical protein